MRRMITNKQIELIEKLSKGIEVNNYAPEIKVACPYTNIKNIETTLGEKEDEETLD